MTPTSARAFAPGRVNLIGEHTDYNGGLALPFAIDRGVTVTVSRVSEGGSLAGEPLIRGVSAELRRDGIPVPDARVEITSDLPVGAGLSSSAALSVALCLALTQLSGAATLDPLQTARICQRVEHGWAGAQTGLLDQLAILHGGPVLIDFSTLTVEPVPIELGDHQLVLLDSGERRELATAGYNERRTEAAQARAADARKEELSPLLAQRWAHIQSENERARAARKFLLAGNVAALGPLLDAAHVSLRDDYDVSTPAVEAARDRLLAAGAIGARIHGGGFGGAVLGLMPPGAAAVPRAFTVTPGPAARLL